MIEVNYKVCPVCKRDNLKWELGALWKYVCDIEPEDHSYSYFYNNVETISFKEQVIVNNYHTKYFRIEDHNGKVRSMCFCPLPPFRTFEEVKVFYKNIEILG